MTSTSILISTFAPFNTLALAVPSNAPISDLFSHIHAQYPVFPLSLDSLTLSTHNGRTPPSHLTVSELRSGNEFVTLRLIPRVLGGKGGFGSQLRAAGGRMSSQKTNNNDSCRDLNGRRLSTIKEAKKLAEYVASGPERLAAKADAQRAKLEALERKLGIDPSASSSSKPGDVSDDVLTGKKHRFDDTEYLEKTEELKEGVKNAVSAALLKKRKKAKLVHSSEEVSEKGKEKPKKQDVVKESVKKNEIAAKSGSATLKAEQPIALDAVGA